MTTVREYVPVWNSVFHLYAARTVTANDGAVVRPTKCGLVLGVVMPRDEVEERGLKLCRFCGEER